jgi:hypothetical protein
MEKVVLLFLGILIVSMMGVLAEEINCTDSDVNNDYPDGKNYYEAGSTISGGDAIFIDNCINDTFLREGYCDENITEGDKSRNLEYDCSSENKICQDAICIEVQVVCSSDNLDLCLDETNCTDVGGYWYDEICNVNENNQTNQTELPGCPELSKNECEADDRCGWDESRNRCRNKNALGKGKTKPLKPWVSDYLGSDECPEGCRCTGSVIRCDTDGGRVMTVVAGKSGNIIIQTKGINASTKVELIKNETGVYANTSSGIKRIKYMPDQIQDKALKRLKMRACGEESNCTIELKEVGMDKELAYELQAQRHAKLLGLFRKKMRVKAQVSAEDGDIILVERPWWAFLATESEE